MLCFLSFGNLDCSFNCNSCCRRQRQFTEPRTNKFKSLSARQLVSLSLSLSPVHTITVWLLLTPLYIFHSLYLSLLYRLCREISFQFRTRLPHGLLVYHNVKNPDRINLDPYALYVIVEKGQLKVVHVFGKHSTSVTVGESLNRDEWHSVMVSLVHFRGVLAWTQLPKMRVLHFRLRLMSHPPHLCLPGSL